MRASMEVILRHWRIDVWFSGEIAPLISSIFQEQSLGFVLGMALEEYEKTISSLYDRVGSSILSSAQHAVSASRQLVAVYVVPSGMGDFEKFRYSAHHWLAAHADAIDNSPTLH